MKGLQRSSLSATLLYYRWHYEKSAYEILNPHLLFSLLQFLARDREKLSYYRVEFVELRILRRFQSGHVISNRSLRLHRGAKSFHVKQL